MFLVVAFIAVIAKKDFRIHKITKDNGVCFCLHSYRIDYIQKSKNEGIKKT